MPAPHSLITIVQWVTIRVVIKGSGNFCRAQEDINKNRLYLHEIYTEAEISKSGTVKPGAVQNLLTDSAAFGKSILNPLYAVKPGEVSKVVDENGEPLVVYRGAEFDPLAQETGKGVIKPEAYFTANPEYARRYTGNGGKVRAYYLVAIRVVMGCSGNNEQI